MSGSKNTGTFILHNGMLHSRKKEGTTLEDSMDRTEAHYAKWNKPGSERSISYGLTYKWNLFNKTSKQNPTRNIEIKNKLNVLRVDGERDNGENRGKAIKEYVWRTHGQSQRGVVSRVGHGDVWGGGVWWGENGDNCIWTIKSLCYVGMLCFISVFLFS